MHPLLLVNLTSTAPRFQSVTINSNKHILNTISKQKLHILRLQHKKLIPNSIALKENPIIKHQIQ